MAPTRMRCCSDVRSTCVPRSIPPDSSQFSPSRLLPLSPTPPPAPFVPSSLSANHAEHPRRRTHPHVPSAERVFRADRPQRSKWGVAVHVARKGGLLKGGPGRLRSERQGEKLAGRRRDWGVAQKTGKQANRGSPRNKKGQRGDKGEREERKIKRGGNRRWGEREKGGNEEREGKGEEWGGEIKSGVENRGQRKGLLGRCRMKLG